MAEVLCGLAGVDRPGQVQPVQLALLNASLAGQQVEQHGRIEPRILACRRPRQRAEGQDPVHQIQDVHEVAHLVAAGQGQHLVDGQVHRMKDIARVREADRRHKPPA